MGLRHYLRSCFRNSRDRSLTVEDEAYPTAIPIERKPSTVHSASSASPSSPPDRLPPKPRLVLSEAPRRPSAVSSRGLSTNQLNVPNPPYATGRRQSEVLGGLEDAYNQGPHSFQQQTRKKSIGKERLLSQRAGADAAQVPKASVSSQGPGHPRMSVAEGVPVR